jgi:hypothetical protein
MFNAKVRELCRQASIEHDPQKLYELVREINREMDAAREKARPQERSSTVKIEQPPSPPDSAG